MPRGYPDDGLPRKKPRACQVCRHPERVRIEALHCAGVSLDRIATKFGVHRDAIWRHAENHMTEEQRASLILGPAKLGDLIEATAEEAGAVLEHYSIVRSVLFNQLLKVAKNDDADGVAKISARITHVLRDIAKITGELTTFTNNTIVNVTNNSVILNSAPVADIQAGLLEVCARHPDARADILELFRRLDEKYASAKPLPSLPMREIHEVGHAAA